MPARQKTLMERLEWAIGAKRSRANMEKMLELISDFSDVAEAIRSIAEAISELGDKPEEIENLLTNYEEGLEDREISADEREDSWGEIIEQFEGMFSGLGGLQEHFSTLRESLPEVMP